MTDNRSVAVEARVPELSVIIELDNIRAKGVTRAELALTALAREISSASRPIEWRIGSPGEAVPLWVGDLILRTGLSVAVDTQHQHVVPVGDRRYYEVKNVLAAGALGNVLVFVDGDVIPEPGWLTRLTAPFVDPSVDVVCGKTVVGPLSSFYVRSIAATWIYDPVRRLGVERVVFFNANNVAFRRNLFAEREFPDERDQYRDRVRGPRPSTGRGGCGRTTGQRCSRVAPRTTVPG